MAQYYREIYYASDDEEEEHPIDELVGLEHAASTATPQQQAQAFVIVARILEARGVMYGGMGGFCFWNLGNLRTTEDVDIAVSGSPSLRNILDYFNNDNRITRPERVMQWASGVARIFVNVGGQLVQIDLKRQGSEGQGIPDDLERGTELRELRDFPGQAVRFFNMFHSLFSKFRAFMGRDFDGDYQDLLFVTTDNVTAPAVKAVADEIQLLWRETFVDRVAAQNPNQVNTVRWALNLDGGPAQLRGGPGGPGGPGNGGGGKSGGKKQSGWRKIFSIGTGSKTQDASGATARSIGSYGAQYTRGDAAYRPPPPRPGTAGGYGKPSMSQVAAGVAADYARTQAARPSTGHGRSRQQQFAMNQGLMIGGAALDYYAQNGRCR